ncbi:hypothetical protein KGM_200188 [Danaus plexippus plexippus]|uniref:Uncharacterized protein n=1 Tax=Danaus plexippus plexippus TaxID=278856 RepID=A0A212F2R3_DANPL|nr:hypothetical protein KGM_200188 [Danaus plexippus plexippus]
MMSQHLSSMFEQLGNFTKNNLTQNSKLKEKENKSSSNHVACGGGVGENQQPSPSLKHGPAQPPPPLKKPCKLRNVTSKAESYDTLYGISNLVSFSLHTYIYNFLDTRNTKRI